MYAFFHVINSSFWWIAGIKVKCQPYAIGVYYFFLPRFRFAWLLFLCVLFPSDSLFAWGLHTNAQHCETPNTNFTHVHEYTRTPWRGQVETSFENEPVRWKVEYFSRVHYFHIHKLKANFHSLLAHSLPALLLFGLCCTTDIRIIHDVNRIRFANCTPYDCIGHLFSLQKESTEMRIEIVRSMFFFTATFLNLIFPKEQIITMKTDKHEQSLLIDSFPLEQFHNDHFRCNIQIQSFKK